MKDWNGIILVILWSEEEKLPAVLKWLLACCTNGKLNLLARKGCLPWWKSWMAVLVSVVFHWLKIQSLYVVKWGWWLSVTLCSQKKSPSYSCLMYFITLLSNLMIEILFNCVEVQNSAALACWPTEDFRKMQLRCLWWILLDNEFGCFSRSNIWPPFFPI